MSNIILLIAIEKWYFNNFSNAIFFTDFSVIQLYVDACGYKNSMKEYVTRQKTIRKVMGWGGGGLGWLKFHKRKFPQEIVNKKYIPTDSGQKNVCPRMKKKIVASLKIPTPHSPSHHFSNGPSVRWPRQAIVSLFSSFVTFNLKHFPVPVFCTLDARGFSGVPFLILYCFE